MAAKILQAGAVALEAPVWAPGISLAAMGILVSGGYQLLKL